MTPTEFEKCCSDILAGWAKEEQLCGFKITHNKIIKASDGRYQIDVYADFTALRTRIKILCECKRYKYSVSREKVVILHRKLDSIGAQKGIMISTSDFQSGALEYANAHGIALIKAEDYRFKHLSHSNGQLENEDDPFLYAEKHMPTYVGLDYTFNSNGPRKVFPTKSMIRELILEQNKKISETMGIELSSDLYY